MKGFLKKVRERFESRLIEHFKPFQRVDAPPGNVLADPAYRVFDSRGVSGYLILRIRGEWNAFNAWIAVTKRKTATPDEVPCGEPNDRVTCEGIRFPICRLWGDQTETWWQLSCPTVPQASPNDGEWRAYSMSRQECGAWIRNHSAYYASRIRRRDDRYLLAHVDQMIDCVIEYGISYFEAVAAGANSSSWPRFDLPAALRPSRRAPPFRQPVCLQHSLAR